MKRSKKGMNHDSMNAVIYCRVSTKEQVHNLSLDTQEARCREYCNRNGWTVLRIFREEGASAKTTQRPEFLKMLRFCETHADGVGYVIVNDLSRFSRDAIDQLTVMAGLQEIGVHLRSATEEIDETSTGRFMSGLKAVINQHDNDVKADRTKLGMRAAVNIGRYPFRGPVGYINVKAEAGINLAPDPERAPLVRKAFELVAERTMTSEKSCAQ